MFITPMPPTSRDIAATLASRMVSVVVTDAAVLASVDADVMVKSAEALLVM
ncbi:MAG: hypothetical protein ACYDCS_04540 [Candidatus Dormibacteria bacterium]